MKKSPKRAVNQGFSGFFCLLTGRNSAVNGRNSAKLGGILHLLPFQLGEILLLQVLILLSNWEEFCGNWEKFCYLLGEILQAFSAGPAPSFHLMQNLGPRARKNLICDLRHLGGDSSPLYPFTLLLPHPTVRKRLEGHFWPFKRHSAFFGISCCGCWFICCGPRIPNHLEMSAIIAE